MPDFIADSPATWRIPDDVREREARQRAEIDANRQANVEAQGSLTAVWDDMAKAWRARACEQAKPQPNDGWAEVTLADIAF